MQGFGRKTKWTALPLIAGILALIGCMAFGAVAFDRFRGYVKLGQGESGDKTLEFDTGDGVNNAQITADDTGHIRLSDASTRLMELPANGVNYVELAVPTALAGNTTLTLPGTAPGATSSILSSNTSGTLAWLSCATANTVLRAGSPASCSALVSADIPTTLTGKTLTGNTAANLISGSGTLVLPTSGTATIPNGTNTIATVASAQTIQSKTIDTTNTINALSDTGLTIADPIDQTRVAEFISGTIATGTVRQFTFPNTSMILAGRNVNNSFTAAQSITGTGGNVCHGIRQVNTAGSSTTASAVCNASGETVIGGGCLCSSASGLRNSYLVNATTWGCDWNAACGSTAAYAICCIQ
jgi:hypothetical protein